jgi:branched-chain amino acid transport system substrate-binding protein
MSRRAIVCLAITLCLGFSWAPSALAADDIRIGVIYPRSGAGARFGQLCVNAAEMAAEDINAAGGIKSLGGAKIKVIVADTQTEPKVAISETERLINREKISAFNGAYYSGHTIPATEISERAQIPWVTGSVSDPITGRGYKYVFQVSPKASHFGAMQVQTLKELDSEFGVKHTKVAIAFEDTAYGTDTAGGIKKECEKLGYQVVLYEPYKAGFTDADPIVSKLKASGAEIFFPVSYLTDAIMILRTMKKLDVNAAFIGGGAGYLMPDFYTALKEDSEYVISVGSWNHDLPYPAVKDFSARFLKKYGEFLPEHAGESYVIMWVIKEALEKAKSSDPQKVRDALASLDIKDGAAAGMPGGHTKFDATGWNEKVHPVMVQWQKGQLRGIWPKDSQAVKPIWPVLKWSDRK